MKPSLPKLTRTRWIAALVGLALIAGFNVYAFTRPALHRATDVQEWRKGPLVKNYSPYASANSARIFWPVAAGMVDAYLLCLVGWRFGVRRRLRRPPAPPAEAGVSLAVLLVVLVGGEIAARSVIHAHWYLQYQPHPELYWYNRPNLHNHEDPSDPVPKSTNSLGFRMDRDLRKQKAEGERRIFVVGDSSTFGLGMRDEQTFCWVLEEELRRRGAGDVAVINSGCPGHTSYQGMWLLERYGIPLGSDVVIWCFNNDPCLDTVEEESRVSHNPAVLAMQRVLYRSDLYLLFRRVTLDFVYRSRLETYARKFPKDKSQWVKRIPFDDYQQYLRQYREVTEAAGAEMLYIRMPINRPICQIEKIYYTSFDDHYREHLTRFCLETGAHYLDIEHPWTEAYSPDLYIPGHLFHPSVKGHRIIGEEMARYVMEHRLLD